MTQPPYVPQQPQYGPPPVPPGQPAYAPQQYAQAPQYAPQPQYQAPYAPPPPPPAPVVNASLEDFLNQPHTGGGASLTFGDKPTGYSVTGRVSRKIGRADIQVQTDQINRQPQFYKDGRPKLVMLVPLDVPVTPEFPEGKATWWVKGNSRDELAAGMARAGSKSEVPEEGSTVVITKTGSRPIQGRTPQVLYRVDYYPPAGTAPAPQPETQPVPAAPEPQYAPPAPPVQAAPQEPAAGPQPTPAQQMLLNQLANGGQPPAPQG